ncbi:MULTISPECIES: hypothetical protein [unclassified Pseudomonas]|uniref:hypothetical protein n=1 Tax=unclassified Pseudomonas TaxID=196821 RepID=UPI000C86C58A|nr:MULTISPECIES: hypothetical protein [unclassified Pseudomonas]PMV22734.1 hypothetical protein C1X17_14125 [Pseudomonas sp. FW305-3-2-15-C-TSA2]PMV29397.1 hypothetical protein C1X22_11695 [Pseudomonas sp. DP16D-L5]PMV39300.1 hypothetical protein C1X21_11810 [Pseudomonas sp. FW305-3-2-15-A-LB2]PMV45610.1 hypothetical protein C1X16_13340 [Pseudomonas sp. FW305-3-2-15-C-R2A1]PMV51947.1 hypothetical protein C1X18_11610 [Pseudomonas sp. FW305-3-2-15-C-LB1]
MIYYNWVLIRAIDLALTADDISQLNQVSELPPECPEWMLETQCADGLGDRDLWDAVATRFS